jgi:hypothetical protein
LIKRLILGIAAIASVGLLGFAALAWRPRPMSCWL